MIVAQSVWWIASLIGLKEGLGTHINNPCIRSEVYQASSVAHSEQVTIHPERLIPIGKALSDIKDQRDLSTPKHKESKNSEDTLHDQVLKDCEKFLQESAFERRKIPKRNLKASKKLSKTKPNKNLKTQTEGIELSEFYRRKAAGECQHCAWPQDRKGGYETSDCFRRNRLENQIAPVPKKR